MRAGMKLVGAAVLLFGLGSAAASAATLDLFTFSLSGVPGTGTATIAASPTPSTFTNGTSFTLTNIAATYLGQTFSGDVTFFETGGAGGGGQVFGGDKLYTGPDSAPTFKLGTFTLNGLVDLGNGPVQETATVTITQVPTTPTPEPGTLGLVGTAGLGLVEAVRRRLRA